jgi:hypothetical protein
LIYLKANSTIGKSDIFNSFTQLSYSVLGLSFFGVRSGGIGLSFLGERSSGYAPLVRSFGTHLYWALACTAGYRQRCDITPLHAGTSASKHCSQAQVGKLSYLAKDMQKMLICQRMHAYPKHFLASFCYPGDRSVNGYRGMFLNIQNAIRTIRINHPENEYLFKKLFIGLKGFFPLYKKLNHMYIAANRNNTINGQSKLNEKAALKLQWITE